MKYLLVLISGPPRSGKNRLGNDLSGILDADHFALSDALKRMTHAHYGLDPELDVFHFEDRKDAPAKEFGGLTPRAAYIHFSESILKPKHGDDHLGALAKRRIAANRDERRITLLSGIGFEEEAKAVVDVVGADRTLHVELEYPDGSPLSISDSRRPLDLTSDGVRKLTLIGGFGSDLLERLEPHLS